MADVKGVKTKAGEFPYFKIFFLTHSPNWFILKSLKCYCSLNNVAGDSFLVFAFIHVLGKNISHYLQFTNEANRGADVL